MDYSKIFEVIFETGILEKIRLKKKKRRKSNQMSDPKEKMKEKEVEQNQVLNDNSKVVVIRIKNYEEVSTVLNMIREGRVVILRTQEINQATKDKIEHTIYGFCYAFDIQPEIVDEHTLVIDPNHSFGAKYLSIKK